MRAFDLFAVFWHVLLVVVVEYILSSKFLAEECAPGIPGERLKLDRVDLFISLSDLCQEAISLVF
jgi:hypothetical protein